MGQKLIKFWVYGGIAVIFTLILALFGYLFVRGSSAISWTFLTDIPRGAIIGSTGGIAPAIVGSLRFTAIAVLSAVLPALATAVSLTFYVKRPALASFMRGVIHCIAGIPSIVLGLFGYSFLVLTLGLGRSVLSGGLTLGVMILPFLEVRMEKALREVPIALIQTSNALGVSAWYTLRKVILPTCRGELVSGIILGACYALGATAPLMFTGAVVNAPILGGLDEPAMALPYHLYLLLTQGTSTENAYGTAFVLMLVLLLSNALATYFAGRRNPLWKKRSR